jgi:hypothetical protein
MKTGKPGNDLQMGQNTPFTCGAGGELMKLGIYRKTCNVLYKHENNISSEEFKRTMSQGVYVM